MKKAAIALVLVIAAIGCSPQKDGEYAFRAPGADSVTPQSNWGTPKPAIPTPKPDLNPPQALK
jgi:hypothetical protein